MNNKIFAGLLLQIPNALVVLGVLLFYLFSKYLDLILQNIGWVILGTMFMLINIASLIFLFIGIFEK